MYSWLSPSTEVISIFPDGSSSREEEELQEAYNCAEFLQRFEMAAELADTFSYSVEEVPGLVQYAPLQDTYHVK